jgi:hypothetical protein
MNRCYRCGKEENQLQFCCVCERDICDDHLAPGIRPGDVSICIECDPITPNPKQALVHYLRRLELKQEAERKSKAVKGVPTFLPPDFPANPER